MKKFLRNPLNLIFICFLIFDAFIFIDDVDKPDNALMLYIYFGFTVMMGTIILSLTKLSKNKGMRLVELVLLVCFFIAPLIQKSEIKETVGISILTSFILFLGIQLYALKCFKWLLFYIVAIENLIILYPTIDRCIKGLKYVQVLTETHYIKHYQDGNTYEKHIQGKHKKTIKTNGSLKTIEEYENDFLKKRIYWDDDGVDVRVYEQTSSGNPVEKSHHQYKIASKIIRDKNKEENYTYDSGILKSYTTYDRNQNNFIEDTFFTNGKLKSRHEKTNTFEKYQKYFGNHFEWYLERESLFALDNEGKAQLKEFKEFNRFDTNYTAYEYKFADNPPYTYCHNLGSIDLYCNTDENDQDHYGYCFPYEKFYKGQKVAQLYEDGRYEEYTSTGKLIKKCQAPQKHGNQYLGSIDQNCIFYYPDGKKEEKTIFLTDWIS